MANNKISGSYNLQSLKIAEYTFVGNNRNGQVEKNTPFKIETIDLSNGSVNDRTLDFITKNRIHLKGIRIVTPGGAGLRSIESAGTFYFCFYDDNNNLTDTVSVVEVARFNEWQEINDYWDPYKLIRTPYFKLGCRRCIINIDDFNIQEKYIGEKVEFKIELMIDTAGIFLDDKII